MNFNLSHVFLVLMILVIVGFGLHMASKVGPDDEALPQPQQEIAQ